MKVEVTPEQYSAIQKLNLDCANALPEPGLTDEFKRFVETGMYFDEKAFETGLREILGDDVVDKGIRGEEIQIVVVFTPKEQISREKCERCNELTVICPVVYFDEREIFRETDLTKPVDTHNFNLCGRCSLICTQSSIERYFLIDQKKKWIELLKK